MALNLVFDAERILLLRMKRGESQTQFAYHVGVSQRAVSAWELGQRRPQGPRILERLLELERKSV